MSEIRLDGQVALVTGASSGIGRACALKLAAAGASVVVNYFSNRTGADDVVNSAAQLGSKAVAHQADVGDEQQVLEMFARIRREFGTLHILVSNAGIQKDADLLDMTLADWQAVMKTNLQGSFLCAREAAREFCGQTGTRRSTPAGHIIFMSSVHDHIPWAGRANYTASKGGLLMLMKTIAQELGPRGVRVNAICPGAIKTDINREVWENESSRRELLEKISYGRVGEPGDVANAVLWLAGSDSDYVHGHALYIDGGMILYPSFREGG